MKILVSKCLLGENCRYCGDNCKNERVLALKARYTLVGVCPEQDGGLPTPRQPAERLGEKVIARDGRDVTREYEAGAQTALETALREGRDLRRFVYGREGERQRSDRATFA